MAQKATGSHGRVASRLVPKKVRELYEDLSAGRQRVVFGGTLTKSIDRVLTPFHVPDVRSRARMRQVGHEDVGCYAPCRNVSTTRHARIFRRDKAEVRHYLARAARKLDQYAAQKIDHSEGGSFYVVLTGRQ